ncbi:MAG TPA: hypothetical protein VI815_02430 [Candidatus Nanoarchaeia archaeon]|nr:hypothetical protein [Candidatus Nanoarchaeia archaeon]
MSKYSFEHKTDMDNFSKKDFTLAIEVVEGLISRTTNPLELRKWKTRLDDLKRRMKKLK